MSKFRIAGLSGSIVVLIAMVLFLTAEDPSHDRAEALPDKVNVQRPVASGNVDRVFHETMKASEVIAEDDITSIESKGKHDSGFDVDELERLLAVMDASFDLSGEVEANDQVLQALQIIADSLPTDLDEVGMQTVLIAVQAHFQNESGESIAGFLVDYLRYREQEAALFEDREFDLNLEAQADLMLQQLELRSQFFDQNTQILLFGAAPSSEIDMLERRAENLDLRSAYRSGQEMTLSPSSDKEPNAVSETQAVLEAAQVMRDEGVDNYLVRDYLVNQLGKDAADNLLLMEVEEAEWLERYDRFAKQASLIESAGISDQEKDQQIDELIARHYPPHEHTAAKAYFYSRFFGGDTDLPESRDL